MVLSRFLAAAALMATLPAQGFAFRDYSRVSPGMVAYDSDRLRLVELGSHGEVREYDGTAFYLRPGIGPRLIGQSVYRSAVQRTFFHGIRLDDTTLQFVEGVWEYDGSSWHDVTPSGQASSNQATSIAYDEPRDRVVLFGGSNLGPDTLEWDGATWVTVATSGPPARVSACMTYDAARQVTVLFGGQVSGTGQVNDHWEWDGTTWTQRTFATAPSARTDAAMAFDKARGVTVLYGGTGLSPGAGSELWEYDGTAWTQITFSGGPGDRWDADMVFDEQSQQTMLVSLNYTTREREYWLWDGANWQLRATAPGTSPATRYASSAYEPITGGVLMHGSLFSGTTWRFANGAWSAAAFGGPGARLEPTLWTDNTNTWLFGGTTYFGNQSFNDVWRWNGAAWQLQPTAAAPPARSGASIAFDSLRGEAVLFGGAVSIAFPDTWTFDGTAWMQHSPPTMPPGRYNPGMAYDPGRDRVVMFGGFSAVSQPYNDTWEWDGTTWSQVATAQVPPPSRAAALAFDPVGNRIVMTRAEETNTMTWTVIDAWTYDGVDWTPLPIAEARVAGSRHALINSAATGEMLLVDTGAVMALVDQPPLVTTVGAGCGSPAPILAARDLPTVGNAEFGLDLVAGTPSSLAVFAGSDTVANQPLLGCTLLVGGQQVTATVPTNASGFATRDLPIPNVPTLLGTQWYFQGLVPQPAAPAGFALSGAVEITVGVD